MTSPMNVDSAPSKKKMDKEDKVIPQYRRLKGVDAAHGQMFESETTLLAYLRCEKLHREWKETGKSGVKSFCVATSVQNFGVFDDVVLKVNYVLEGVTKTKLIFVQCKHVADTSKSETRYEKYMNDQKEIQKWFDSYVRIRNILTEKYIREELLDKIKNKSMKHELHKKQRQDIFALKNIYNCDFNDCEFVFISNMNPENEQISEKFENCASTFPCSDYSSQILKTSGRGNEVRLRESALKFIEKSYNKPDVDHLKKEFCKRFRVFLNQSDDHEFFIKKEIASYTESFQITSIMYKELFEELTQHFNTGEYCELLTERTNLVSDVWCSSELKRKSAEMIDECRAAFASKMFSEESMQDLSEHLITKEVLEIRTSSKKIEKLKLIQHVMARNEDCLLLFLNNEEDVSNWTRSRKTNIYKSIPSIYIFSEPFLNITPLHDNEIFVQVIEDNGNYNYFDQLSEEQQKTILHANVCFQGVTMKLQDICRADSRHMLDEKIICDILSHKQISIAEPLPKLAFYMERNFEKLVFQEEMLNEVKQFVERRTSGYEFLLFDENEGIQETKTSTRLFKDRESARNFINDTKLEEEKTCHLCCCKSNDLHPLYTFGNNDKHTVKKVIKEEELLNMSRKITILSGVAGMGKTTTMLSLAREHKIKNPSHWVQYIQLNNCQKFLEQNFKHTDPSTVVEFVANDLLGLEGIEKHLFVNACERTGDVALFLDGVDEISLEAFNCFESQLLAISKTNISRIFITSRTSTTKYLEKTLLCQSITFVPLANEERERFLINTWKETLQMECQEIDETMLKNIKTMAKVVNTSLLSDDTLRIPLLIKMCAATYFNLVSIPSMSESGLSGISLNQIYLSNLYEKFIEMHINRYLVEKQERNFNFSREDCFKNRSKNLHEKHSEVSNSICNSEIPRTRTDDTTNSIEYFKELGLITNRDTPIFVHRTIAEYLAAKHIFSKVFKKKCENEFLNFLFKSVLIDNKFSVLRKFLNSLLSETNLQINKYNTDEANKLVNSKPEYKSLCVAAAEGNTEIIKLQLHFDETMLNEQNDTHETPLHLACSKGHVETVQYLLSNYVSLDNVLDKDGNTILHVAAREGRKEIFELILNTCKFLINIGNKKGESPLHVACISYHTEVVETLISQYEDISKLVDNDGNTVLHSLFLQKQNLSGETSLQLPVIANNTEATKLLLRDHSQIECSDNDTAFQKLIQNKNIEILKLLLKHDISLLKQKNRSNQTSLHLAILANNEEAVKLLLTYKEYGINDVDTDGNTSLHFAAKKSSTRIIISVLIHAPSQFNTTNNRGETPLHIACAEDNSDAAMLFLLYSDCHLAVRNHNGDSVLHALAKNGNIEVINSILERNASLLNEKNKDGQTPLHIAIRENKVDVVKTLLVRTDCSIEAKDNRDETVLHYAALNGNVELIKLLFPRGNILINIINKSGDTPLELAIKEKNDEASAYLCTYIVENLLGNDDREVEPIVTGVDLKRLKHESFNFIHKKPKISHSVSYGENSITFVHHTTAHSSHQNFSIGTSSSSNSPSFLTNSLTEFPDHIVKKILESEELSDTGSKEKILNAVLDAQDEINSDIHSGIAISNISSSTSVFDSSSNLPNNHQADEFSDKVTGNVSKGDKTDFPDEIHRLLQNDAGIQGTPKSKYGECNPSFKDPRIKDVEFLDCEDINHSNMP